MKKENTKNTNQVLTGSLYDQKAKSVGSITLPNTVFGLKWNADLVHQVALAMLANKRSGTAHTKDRGEVSGGGKKPWKQKGTGRARHGSSRSPIWVGGGVTFGPRNDKDYSQKINKKMRVKALFTVLSKKFAENQILFVDAINLDAIKTKTAQSIVETLATIAGFERLTNVRRTTVLMVLPENNEVIEKSFANLPGITIKVGKDISALDVMSFKYIVMVKPETVSELLESKIK